MSAPNPVSSPAGDLRPAEPSMEEILASIRRIIADDQSFPDRVRFDDEPAAAAAPTPASIHVLHSEAAPGEHQVPSEEPDLPADAPPQPGDDAMIAQGIVAAPQFASPNGPMAEPAQIDPVEAPPSPAHEAHGLPEPEVEAGPAGVAPPSDDSRDPVFAATSAPEGAAPLFSAATNSSVASAFNVLAASRLADNSEDLLGLAREMIRPLLRAWLDENLPSMVERMVRDEIERVARGGH